VSDFSEKTEIATQDIQAKINELQTELKTPELLPERRTELINQLKEENARMIDLEYSKPETKIEPVKEEIEVYF
jgi:archaellum component FlaC